MMAQDLLYITHTGGVSGGGWSLRSSSNLRSATTSDNNGTGPQHQCNTGSGTSSNYGVDNFSSAFSSITSLQLHNRQRRTGVTDNSTARNNVGRNGASDWWYGPLRQPVNSLYTDTVTAPSGGWTDAKLDALRIAWYYQEPVGTSSNYIYFDYIEFRVNYVLPAGLSVVVWSLPMLGALPFIEDFMKAVRFFQRSHIYSTEELGRIRESLVYPVHFDMGGDACPQFLQA